MDERVIEALAAYSHESWVRWMEYTFGEASLNVDGSFTVSGESYRRWGRQLHMSYAELSESEKESDREEARRILKLVVNEVWKNQSLTDDMKWSSGRSTDQNK